jgi:hypothetical protein
MSVETGSPAGATVQKVFICYRREDTAPYAGRIYDAMVSRFGVENVFMDLDLPPGVDFVDRITKVVSGCVALIVVIGPRWAQLQNEDGTRRIEDPEDFVRLEVETGLRRHDVTPIPVLVGGARMPRRDALPPELQALTRRNALELSEGRWAYDIGRLLSTLDELLPTRTSQPQRPAPPLPATPFRGALGWWEVLEGALVAAGTAFVVRRLAQEIPFEGEKAGVFEAVEKGEKIVDEESGRELVSHIGAIVTRRGITFGFVGAVLTVWLARRVWRTYPLGHLLRGLLVGALAGVVGGAIFGAGIYLPEETVPLGERDGIDLVAMAVTGGILGSLVGRLWHPTRTGPAVVAGALGGFLAQAIVAIAGWHNPDAVQAALRFAFVAATIVGMVLATMLLGDRAEARDSEARKRLAGRAGAEPS